MFISPVIVSSIISILIPNKLDLFLSFVPYVLAFTSLVDYSLCNWHFSVSSTFVRCVDVCVLCGIFITFRQDGVWTFFFLLLRRELHSQSMVHDYKADGSITKHRHRHSWGTHQNIKNVSLLPLLAGKHLFQLPSCHSNPDSFVGSEPVFLIAALNKWAKISA